ncbi:MAG: hypothetical protein V1736_05465 [Pseudomonadota bacterium]
MGALSVGDVRTGTIPSLLPSQVYSIAMLLNSGKAWVASYSQSA